MAGFTQTTGLTSLKCKSHPAKLALAARLPQETILSVKQIAQRLHLGQPKGARTNLHKFMNNSQTDGPQTRLDI